MGFFDFGRNFLNQLPVVGGLTTSLWGDPEQEAMQAAFARAQEEQKLNRANMMQGRMNMMDQGSLAFGPRNQMLGEMMGKRNGEGAFDLAGIMQNPMPQSQQDQILQNAFGQQGKPKSAADALVGLFGGNGSAGDGRTPAATPPGFRRY